MKVALCLAMAGILTSSCVGSFAMFNKLASWNKTATDNKFLNELIFIVISPAYAFAGLADALVLNSLEFWTGDNPMARRVGKTVNVQGEDGLIYAVKTLKKGYEITDPQGKVYYVTYKRKTILGQWKQKVRSAKSSVSTKTEPSRQTCRTASG